MSRIHSMLTMQFCFDTYNLQFADLIYLISRHAIREITLGMLPGEHMTSRSFEITAILHLEPFKDPHSGIIKRYDCYFALI